MIKRQLSNRRIRLGVGLFLALGLLIQYQRAMSQSEQSFSPSPKIVKAEAKVRPNMAFASMSMETPPIVESLEDKARRDPMGFI